MDFSSSPYLPSPFSTSDLWAVSIRNPQTGQVQERLVLADDQDQALESIFHHFEQAGLEPLLVMGLDHLRALHHRLEQWEATQGTLPETPLARHYPGPTWEAAQKGSFVVTWRQPNGVLETTWIRANTAGEALLSAHHQHPQALVLGVGHLESLGQHLEDLGGCVLRQDFSQIGWDFRTQASHPATAAHLEGARLAQRGAYPSQEEGMLAIHRLYLNDQAEDEEPMYG